MNRSYSKRTTILLNSSSYFFIAPKVHGAIDVGEKKVRDLVVAKVAESTARQTLRFAIGSVLRLGVGVGVYSLTKYAFRDCDKIK